MLDNYPVTHGHGHTDMDACKWIDRTDGRIVLIYFRIGMHTDGQTDEHTDT